MSDYKGAALMLHAFPKAKSLLADKATTPTGSETPWPHAGLRPVFHLGQAERLSSRTTRRSTKSATRSRTCSAGSRTGAEFTPDTIAALTPSFQPYASQQPSSSGFDLTSLEPRYWKVVPSKSKSAEGPGHAPSMYAPVTPGSVEPSRKARNASLVRASLRSMRF